MGRRDASDLFDSALHTFDPGRGVGAINYSEYSNAEVDRLIDQSAGIQKAPERRAVLQQISRLVMRDRPWLPLYVDLEAFGFDPRIDWRPRNDGYVLASEIAWRP